VEARQVAARRELDELRVELDALRTSRRRLVESTDGERRAIERDLHDGLHQQLIALAVSLQLAGREVQTDPAAAVHALADVESGLRRALDETARLAQRIHPPTLEPGDLGALLRAAATGAGVPAAVEVSIGFDYAPDLVMTIHLCWLAALSRADGEARVTIDVRERRDALTFEIEGTDAGSNPVFEGLHDRVAALGGTLEVTSTADGGGRVAGFLPVAS
jgi:signal transduction histidine kinase